MAPEIQRLPIAPAVNAAQTNVPLAHVFARDQVREQVELLVNDAMPSCCASIGLAIASRPPDS